MKTGIELIAQERAEQLEKHHRTVESDVKENTFQQLVIAAICLLKIDDKCAKAPLNWSQSYFDRMMQKSEIDRLKIAGALIAAEIDRIKYLKQKDCPLCKGTGIYFFSDRVPETCKCIN